MAPSSNWNVRCTLAFYPALTICTSLATSAPLAAYILLRTGSNVKVGLAVGAQGVANLLAAFPAAWLGDRWSRPMVIRVAAALGVGGMSALGASVLSPGLERHARVQYGAICGALLILGLFMGGHSSSVEALFGDSVESGRRSALYARKSALKVLGNAAGPLVSIAVFASLGDEWRKGELEVVIACGCCFFVLPAALACSLGEAHTLGGSLSESLLSGGGRESESAPRKTDRATEVRIAATVCAADVVSMLGSGMTIKFFPLFFWKEVGLTPIQVQVIYVLAPSGIAACSLVAQRASRRFGRVQTTVATKLAGISLLVAMSRVGAGVAERARWNAAESINLFSWSGSAALGGYLIDRHGYRVTFLVTAAIQFVAALILASIALLVRSERPRAAATSPDDDGDETASRTSSGGYSLLDFDDTLRLDTPPHEMTDAQIDELLSATTNLVTPTKLRPVSEGDETGEEAPPPGTQYTTL
ncbi:major facilitator superfamily protein [Aureococcus anophagefferens]|uniref:Major facilitator superfamily protein n=1 Tax=Aureococcus anophagefferens TaxID=44056 RepID=A0ABR1G1U6_AURAN